MRRLVILVCALAAAGLIAAVPSTAQTGAQTAAPPQALTFQGEVALWTMAIKPDKIADFEAVMAKLRDGLAKSAKPERRQQGAGWKIMKMSTPLPDGNVAYVHMINPVVPGADYTIMQTLYDEFPNERQSLYELYRGAFVKNLSVATGSVVLDLSKTPEASSPSAP
jgi:hypothetical protein